MNKIQLDGAWYSEAWPGGAFCALITGKHIATHMGNFPLPNGQNTLFLRGSEQGGFMFAGQSHDGAGNMYWKDGKWRTTGTSYGVNPVIYDNAGILHEGAPVFGSQGFRFVDANNRIWTGDETYADPARKIWEWTQHGDVTVGFSETNVIAIHGDTRYILSTGGKYGANSVRFNRTGDACAVTWHDTSTLTSSLLFFTVAELVTFPVEGVTPPIQPPIEPPVEPPTEPVTVKIPQKVKDNIYALYERHKNLAEGSDEDRRALMKLITEQNCFDLGATHGWKSADTGRPPSKDAIAYSASADDASDVYMADVFSGTTRQPAIPEDYELSNPRQHFIRMDPVNHLGSTPTEPPVEPPASDVDARLDALEAQDKRLGETDQDLATAILLLEAKLNKLTERVVMLEATEHPAFEPSDYQTRVTWNRIHIGTFPLEDK